MGKTVICPGSFDPVTLGHLDIISRASKMFDHVIVAVLVNPAKEQSSFSIQERIELLVEATKGLDNIEIVSFRGLLAEYAKERNVTVIVKGLRAVSDFEYEFQMALTNKRINPELETIFLTTESKYMYLSSSIVKQIASLGGSIKGFVPDCVLNRIVERLSKKQLTENTED